jgi:DNA-binding response OmpR family regulator
MKQAIVVDANANNRSTLMHQLSQCEFSSTFQFKTLSEAHNKLLGLTLFSGVLLCTIDGENPAVADFLRYSRAKHPNLCFIAIVDSLSLTQMRSLIGLGIDHVLLRPFNVSQLLEKVKAAQSFRNQVLSDTHQKSDNDTFEAPFERITDHYYKISLRGTLVEHAELPTLPLNLGSITLFVDCDHLIGINSIGIRSWILWFKQLESQGVQHFEFDNLRPPILQQTSFVQGFIPKNSVVNSFFLYYWCETLQEEKEFKIVYGKNYGTTQMRLPQYQIEMRGDQKCLFAIHESAKKLLRFFKGTIEIISPRET